jgi:hypothetical protein
MNVFIYIVSFFYITSGLFFAFLYVLRGGEYNKGILIGWGGGIVGGFVTAVVFPAIVSLYNQYYCQFFPEANGIGFMIIFGWFAPLVVVTIAGILRKSIIHFWPQTRLLGMNKKITISKGVIVIGLFCILLGVIMLGLLFLPIFR